MTSTQDNNTHLPNTQVLIPANKPNKLSYIEQAAKLANQNSIDIPIAEQPGKFLQAVWGALPNDSLCSILAEIDYKKANGALDSTQKSDWMWLKELRDVPPDMAWAHEHNTAAYTLPGMGSIYYNAASRKHSVLHRPMARGSLDELNNVAAFWCDLDCAVHGYDLETGLKALLDMPLKPSLVVFSGGGLQAIHLLSEAWPVLNREAALHYKEYSLALYDSVYRKGFDLDKSVHEAARMMRLPGFINQKTSRLGAVARLVYYKPDVKYTISQIKAAVTLPEPKPIVVMPYKAAPDGTYKVNHDFIAYMIDGELPVERHTTIRAMAWQAAISGIQQDIFIPIIRRESARWFGSAEQHRTDKELDNVVSWSYSRAAELPVEQRVNNAQWLVRLSDDCTKFERAAPAEQEKITDKTVIIEVQNMESAAIGQPLATVRKEQGETIRSYLDTRHKFGTIQLLRSSPGAGKTHAAFNASALVAIKYAELHKDDENPHGHVAILTLFKFEENSWKEYVQSFGIDPKLVFYLVARNGDPLSAGYCANHAQAEALGKKHWNVHQTLCQRCPLQPQCTEGWYLSQMEKAKTAPILLARHAHGVIESLVGYRKVIVFDESPLDIVSAHISLKQEDLSLDKPVYEGMAYQDEMVLIEKFLSVLRGILASQPVLPRGKYAGMEHVQFGGRWLFDRLVRLFGAEQLNRLCSLDEEIIKTASRAGLPNLTLESVAALPINYLQQLLDIVKQEYTTKFQANVKAWNSRLIPWLNTLRMYPMEPFKFTRNTHVVITDATGLPELYGKAFMDKQGTPRAAHVFEGTLEAKARIIQYTGSALSKSYATSKAREDKETTRRDYRKLSNAIEGLSSEIKIELSDIGGNSISIDPAEIAEIEYNDNAMIKQSKKLIKSLSEAHHGSLLVVSYKETVQKKLQKWARKNNILNPDYIQWFGSLRGKNDYKMLSAALLIGTPRIPELDLLAMAQAWHWNDPIPISCEKMYREIQYIGYQDGSGQGRARGYIGYKDDRVNSLYVHLITAELRQSYERVRPNASDDPRTIYLATDWPCSDHVDELRNWGTMEIDEAARLLCAEMITRNETELVKELVARVECDPKTARAAIRTVAENLDTKKPGEKVREWLKADQTRLDLTAQTICDVTGASLPTVRKAVQELKKLRG